jgi:transcriptional regulator with XRE-family HTH domain
MDYSEVAADFLRALRGRRSQVQWSRRLGYKSNVAYAWESGRRWPTASEALRAAGRDGVDVHAAVSSFYGEAPAWLAEVDPASPAGVARLLQELKGSLTITALAQRVGTSRYALSRWLNGTTQPRLPDFLATVDAASVRLVDFVTALVPAERMPAVQALWERQEARRRGAFEAPWTQAVLRAFELVDYRALPRHEPGWVARRLGIPEEVEQTCVVFLEASGQVRWTGTHYAQESLAVDTRSNPEIGRALKVHWTGVAQERIREGAPGQFSYNVFVVSRQNFERIREMHLAYFHALRSLVSEPQAEECVAIANVQLFALDPEG